MDLNDQCSDLIPVFYMERVSSAEGDSRNIILAELRKQLLSGYIVEGDPAIDIPCDGILAVFTAMASAGNPEDGAKTVPI